MEEVPYTPGQVLRKPADWKNLRFYQKSDALFQLTFIFCERFLPKYGDRTVDQMVQAARSGKQNIIEGSEDGKTSTEMELKLLNVARSSVGELREDYRDHINNHHLSFWEQGHPRFQAMLNFTRTHNQPADFLPFAQQCDEEEFCNICLTLCFQIDAMMNRYLKELEKSFVTEGGIKERMHKARTGYRNETDEHLRKLSTENQQLLAENRRLQADNQRLQVDNQRLQAETQQLQTFCSKWQASYEDLKQRALAAYNRQQAEIATLSAQLEKLRAHEGE